MTSTDTETEPTERLASPTTSPSKAKPKKAKPKKAKPKKAKKASVKSSRSATKRPAKKSTSSKSKPAPGTAADRKAKGLHLLLIRTPIAVVSKMRKVVAANKKRENGPTSLQALAVEVLTAKF